MQTSRANNLRILRVKKVKFSGYYFYMNTNIQKDFQNCIRVPLMFTTRHWLNNETELNFQAWNIYFFYKKASQRTYSQSHSCAQMGNGHRFCFVSEIKPLRGCRLWASRPIFQNQCPKSLIPVANQVAVFPMGPKMKVTKSKNNWGQMINHSKRRKKYQKII